MLLVVGGMIGLGKSSVAKILGEHFKSDVFYESVDDNPLLPLFYSESEEEIQRKRYPFLLQLYFLNTRFKSIKEALINDNNIRVDTIIVKSNNSISSTNYNRYKLL